MSKIRDLFKKILPKKKRSEDLEDIFIDEEDVDINLNEDDVLDGELFEDEPFEQDQLDQSVAKTQDVDDTPPPKFEKEPKLDREPEFDSAPEPQTETEFQPHESDLTAESDFTAEIDLDEGKVSFRDKIDHLGTRLKDRFRNLNTKDLNEAYKERPEAKIGSKLNKLGANKFGEMARKINLDDLKSKAINFNWANLPNKFFADQNKRNYHRYFQMVMIVFATFAIAKFSGSLFSGDKKYNEMGRVSVADIDDSNKLTNQDLQNIADSGLFKTAKPVIEKPEENEGPKPTALCKVANKKSGLNIQLVDTIVLQDSVKSIAAVQLNSKKDLTMAREGDELKDMKVGRIERSRMIFRNLQSQDCEYIEQKKYKRRGTPSPPDIMPPPKAEQFKRTQKEIKGIKQEGNNFTVERDFLKTKLSDINTILTEAKGIMIKNPDGTVSFKIVQVDPGGIFAYLGVQENDIINSINGEPIKELNDVMSLFGKLPTLNKLELGFDRAGQPVDQKYTIE